MGPAFDQDYQHQLNEGMTRCYMVRDIVGGFGHQQVNALLPSPGGTTGAPVAGKRLYYPPNTPEFQNLKNKMETQWLDELLTTLDLKREQLPVLWDADFLHRPEVESNRDSHVLCEINTSSVHPYPESIPDLVAADLLRALSAKRQ